MQFKYLPLLCLLFLLLTGCEKDRVYESIYEGMHNREEIVNPSDDPIPQKHQSYDKYKKEREEILKNEDKE